MEGTTVGQAFDAEVLSPPARKALAVAIDQLIDASYDDLEMMSAAAPENGMRSAEIALDTTLGGHLPQRHAVHYTLSFMRRFVACLSTVAWKLAQPEWMPPACIAEDLALNAIIREAEVVLETEGEGPFDFGGFMDAAFDDVDFEYLFAPQYDGIDTSSIGEDQGMASLAIGDWFRAYGGVRHPYSAVHPYASDDPTRSTR